MRVILSGLLTDPTCVSLAVTVFNSFPTLFIYVFTTALTRSSEFSSFSLAKIEFEFSLCELDSRLNLSAVTLLASGIAPSSSSLVTLKTASRIFALDNGVFLL